MASLEEIEAKARARLAQLEAADAPKGEGGELTGVAGAIDTANTAAGHVVENLMMGYGDEASAALGAGVDWLFGNSQGKSAGDLYDARLNRSRAKMDAFRERNPVLTAALEVAGGAVPAVATMGAAMGPAAVRLGTAVAPKGAAAYTARPLGRVPFKSRVARGVAAGAGYGAGYGFGAGRDGFDNRLGGTFAPGLFGGAVGSAIPVVGAVARPFMGRLAKHRTAKEANIPARAVDPVQESLEKAAKDPEALVKGGTAGSLGIDMYPETAALAGEAMSKLGRFGGPAKKKLSDRAESGMKNIDQQLDEAMGKTAGLKTIVRRLDSQSAPAISNAYKTAYSRPIDYASETGIALENILKTRVSPEALRKARRMMRTEGVESEHMLYRIVGEGDDARVVFDQRLPDVREVDYITRALNDMVESHRNPKTDKLTGEGRGLANLSKEIRGRLREAVPEWGAAVDMAKPDILKRELVEFGEKVLSPRVSLSDVNALVARMKRTHPKLVDMIEPSIAQGLRNNIDNVVSRAKTPLVPELGQSGFVTRGAQRDPEAVKTLKELTGRANREKISAIIGEEKASVLFDQVDEAAEAIATNETMGENLRKAAREMLDAKKARNDRGVAGNLVRGKPRDTLGVVFDRIRKEGDVPKPNKTSEAIVNYLLQPADRESMTRVLRARHKSERGLKGAKRAEMGAGGSALAIGLPQIER